MAELDHRRLGEARAGVARLEVGSPEGGPAEGAAARKRHALAGHRSDELLLIGADLEALVE
jgi:hypothetical protein